MANTKVKAEQLEAAQTNITSVGTLTSLAVSGTSTFGGGSTLTNTGVLTLEAGGNLTTASGNDLNIVYPDGRSLFIKEASTTHVTVDNAGNVGIGNTAPLGKLTISSAAGANAPTSVTAANTYLQLGSDDFGASNNGKFMIGFGYTDATNTNSPAYIGFEETSTSGDTKGELTFYTRDVITDTAPTERLRITDGGNVGIGTASPDVNSFGAGHGVLTVQSATGSAKTAMLNLSGDGNDTDATRVASLFFNDASATGAGKSLAGIEAYRASNHATDPGGDLLFSTNLSGGSYTEKMRIEAGGSVGIGTTDPKRMLQVGDNTQAIAALSLQTTTSGLSRIYMGDNDGTAAEYAGMLSYVHSDNQMQLWTSSGIKTVIDSSGRVLIGGQTSHANGYSTPGGNSGENAHYSKLWIQGNTYSTAGDGRMTLASGTSWPSSTTAIGQIFFSTAWGGDHAAISCYTAGATGNTDYPGELRFYTTPDGSSTLTHNMSVKQDGSVHIGGLGVGLDSNYAALTIKDNNVNRSADCTAYIDSGGTADWTMRVGGSYEYALRVDTTSSASYAIGAVADSSSWKFRVQGNGSIYAVNTDISSISDRRLKENITDAKSQWDDIKALKWKNFNWTKESGHDDGKTKLGLIADEVEKISPNLIQIDAQSKEDKDAGKEDPEYKTVKYSIVWVKAMKALQEAMERIETLEAEVKTLKGG